METSNHDFHLVYLPQQHNAEGFGLNTHFFNGSIETSDYERNFELVDLPQQQNAEELRTEPRPQVNPENTRTCVIKAILVCLIVFLVLALLTIFFKRS